jgi:hypothetical protein
MASSVVDGQLNEVQVPPITIPCIKETDNKFLVVRLLGPEAHPLDFLLRILVQDHLLRLFTWDQ